MLPGRKQLCTPEAQLVTSKLWLLALWTADEGWAPGSIPTVL